jgi:hypothetical protein
VLDVWCLVPNVGGFWLLVVFIGSMWFLQWLSVSFH